MAFDKMSNYFETLRGWRRLYGVRRQNRVSTALSDNRRRSVFQYALGKAVSPLRSATAVHIRRRCAMSIGKCGISFKHCEAGESYVERADGAIVGIFRTSINQSPQTANRLTFQQ
jgi:hypothetical protein